MNESNATRWWMWIASVGLVLSSLNMTAHAADEVDIPSLSILTREDLGQLLEMISELEDGTKAVLRTIYDDYEKEMLRISDAYQDELQRVMAREAQYVRENPEVSDPWVIDGKDFGAMAASKERHESSRHTSKTFVDHILEIVPINQRKQWENTIYSTRRKRLLKEIKRDRLKFAMYDLLAIAPGVALSDASRVAIAPTLEAYRQEIDFRVGQWEENKIRLYEGSSRNGIYFSLTDEREIALRRKRWEEFQKQIDALLDAITKTNRLFAARIMGILPPDETRAFELAIRGDEFPSLVAISPPQMMLEAIEDMESLDERQRDCVRKIVEGYEVAREHLALEFLQYVETPMEPEEEDRLMQLREEYMQRDGHPFNYNAELFQVKWLIRWRELVRESMVNIDQCLSKVPHEALPISIRLMLSMYKPGGD